MIREYIKKTGLAIVCFIVVMLLVNGILLTSISLSQSLQDISYLNILLLSVSLIFWLFGFHKHRKRILPVRKLMGAKNPAGSAYNLLKTSMVRDQSVDSALLEGLADFLYDDFKETIRHYQKNMDELNDYITQWVHEVKIPMSVLELLLENDDRADDDTSRKMKIELERTRFLIDQVLYAGRAAHYNEDLRISEFSLAKLVREAVKRNATPFIMKNIEIGTKDLDLTLMQDEKWISYILDQILNNAAKYTAENGKIDIWAVQNDQYVRLCIQDDGIGIPEHELNRIFEKGFTGENGRKMGKSTGMGMYYAKKIAERLDVGMEVFSEQHVFTRFELIFKKAYNW